MCVRSRPTCMQCLIILGAPCKAPKALVSTYVCVCVYVSMCVSVYVCICLFVYASMCLCVYVCMCMWVCGYNLYTYIYVCKWMHMCVFMRVCESAHACMCTDAIMSMRM